MEDIEKRREPLPLAAVYFISPTPSSVQHLVADFDSKPLYPSVHVFFSSGVTQEAVDKIKRCRVRHQLCAQQGYTALRKPGLPSSACRGYRQLDFGPAFFCTASWRRCWHPSNCPCRVPCASAGAAAAAEDAEGGQHGVHSGGRAHLRHRPPARDDTVSHKQQLALIDNCAQEVLALQCFRCFWNLKCIYVPRVLGLFLPQMHG